MKVKCINLVWNRIVNEFISWNSQHETSNLALSNQFEPEPTISEDKVIPFQFTIKMPLPRYYPEILKRDEKGRIVHPVSVCTVAEDRFSTERIMDKAIPCIVWYVNHTLGRKDYRLI